MALSELSSELRWLAKASLQMNSIRPILSSIALSVWTAVTSLLFCVFSDFWSALVWLSTPMLFCSVWMLHIPNKLAGRVYIVVRPRFTVIISYFMKDRRDQDRRKQEKMERERAVAVSVLVWLSKPMLFCSVWMLHIPVNKLAGRVYTAMYTAVRSPFTVIISYCMKDRRDQDRRKQEKMERERAGTVAQKFVADSNGLYSQLKPMVDMGSRMQKLWFQLEGEGGTKIMTVAPVSTNCPLKLEKDVVKTLNKLLMTMKHPFVQVIERVEYLSEGDLIMVQPLMGRGSLKDLIYGVRPIQDWSVKYAKYGTTVLSSADIASYGRQILEGVLHLYKFGLRPLGHIQTGNIYIEGETCRIGGYENMLLGYRTRIYRMCKALDCCEDIDIILFGCIIFEMACGYELTQLFPGEQDYRSVRSEVIREVLIFIFRRNQRGRVLATIEEILALGFFQEAILPQLKGVWSDHISLTRNMRNLISEVVRGKDSHVPPKHHQKCSLQ